MATLAAGSFSIRESRRCVAASNAYLLIDALFLSVLSFFRHRQLQGLSFASVQHGVTLRCRRHPVIPQLRYVSFVLHTILSTLPFALT
jgi:hypothetical protein